tara:strand:+ start:158 stop:343 length:186 start_codon:yes stop_codon:yes gene_type:complete
MYELTKAIFLLAISAPILFGVNRLTSSLNDYPDQTNSALYDATHTQTYGKGTYQVASYGRF